MTIKQYPDNPTPSGEGGWPYHDQPYWPAHASLAADGNGKAFVYERNQLIVRRADVESIGDFLPGGLAAVRVQELSAPVEGRVDTGLVLLLDVAGDVVALARRLRRAGFTVQVNHVFFADPSGIDDGLDADPVTFSSAPVRANPVTFSSSPFNANPVTFSGLGLQGDPVTFSGGGLGAAVGACCADCFGTNRPPVDPTRIPSQTLALSVPDPDASAPASAIDRVMGDNVGGGMKVVILDTGLADGAYRPDFVGSDVHASGIGDTDQPDEDGDAVIDPASGHGTFIAGIIKRMAPGADIEIDRVLSTYGAGDEALIAAEINALAEGSNPPHVLNLSFSGYTEDDQPPIALVDAIQNLADRGTVVVASAGNSAQCRKAWPAADPVVVSVGALGPFGPAPFTNFGPWVRACAPGVDVISWFFEPKEGEPASLPTDRRDRAFAGWAAWNGTSFSAPIVIGALLQRHELEKAKDANRTLNDTVAAMIDDPDLCRIPGLGTAVNALP